MVDGLISDQEPFVVDLLDIRGGDKLPTGDIRAPLISWKQSIALYGIER